MLNILFYQNDMFFMNTFDSVHKNKITEMP